MFDAGRTLAFAWALFCVLRVRAWLAVAALALAAYVFALAIASGFTVRADGPMSPVMAPLLAILGPTSLPRGALPPWPLAAVVVHAPVAGDLAMGVALLAVARRMIARAYHLPQFSERTHQISRAALAIVLVAVFEGLSAATRALPALLDWGG
jgi:hypothetical protein